MLFSQSFLYNVGDKRELNRTWGRSDCQQLFRDTSFSA